VVADVVREPREKKNCFEHKRNHSIHEGNLSQPIYEYGWTKPGPFFNLEETSS
jgi:hypothetical protein